MILPYSNMVMKHWNPGAEKPLILPILNLCNTDDAVLHSNIRHNSRLPVKWLNAVPAHNKVALLCGSGPSIADHLEEIRQQQQQGAMVFALNGCAKFLNDHGILADYQAILDARIETADLVGPALRHVFASQVHPECFDRVPTAILYHLQIEGIDDLLPEDQPEHVLIGGAASVGNTTTCVAYALGYRHLKCYGYDSSNKGTASHAFHQKINDGEPQAYVDFNGKTYLCSLTMKLQAEKFMSTSEDLKALGCKVEVIGYGLLPDMYSAPKEVLAELDKYTEMWNHPAYRDVSPGEMVVGRFLKLIPRRGTTILGYDSHVIDFGCGTGRAGMRLAAEKFKVTLVDLTLNSRDPGVDLPFVQADITLPMHLKGDYGFCTDVMEHLPTDAVERTVRNIFGCVRQTFFQISTVHDEFGGVIGHPLHLTVRPHSWWKDLFTSLGFKVLWDEEQKTSSLFLVER